jgi:K+-sensing histidine kinase KdpD
MNNHRFRSLLATIVSSAEILQYRSERLTRDERDELVLEIGRAAEGMTRMLNEAANG